jgi:hypothetical protein
MQYEYKVMTLNDRYFRGKFDPKKIQDVLNDYAEDGWRLKSIATADIPAGFGSSKRQELVIVLERAPG